MKSAIKPILGIFLLLSATSCIEETFPNSSYMTDEQVNQQPNAVEGFVNSIPGTLASTGTLDSYNYWEIGYPGIGMTRDVYCEDFPIYAVPYDYFYYYGSNTYLGDYSPAMDPWNYYYTLVFSCNTVLQVPFAEENRHYHGIAHFWRAYFYFDMARLWEFKATGYPELDGKYDQIKGLTVPIITEQTTEEDARHLPRAKYYDMYKFLIDELDLAEEYLADYTRPNKSNPDLSAVYGEKARLYLEIATRFEKFPADEAETAQSGVDLGVADATAAYQKAIEYADKAINSGHAPLSELEWYGGSQYADGFNSMGYSSWMLGFTINQELLTEAWCGFNAYLSPETYYGIAGVTYTDGVYSNTYTGQRMISSKLYDAMSKKDWRRGTWINPDDAGNPDAVANYKTNIAPEHFAVLPAYTGFKFRPKNNERVNYSVGAAVDYPMMRVEEMYFIKAEASAYVNGVGDGISQLVSFMNTYRTNGGGYFFRAGSMDAFRKELMVQKRIELWGEGLIAFDYKRLLLPIERGYEDTNFPSAYQLVSKDGYCAPWLNYFIPTQDIGRDDAMLPNPDPSLVRDVWE